MGYILIHPENAGFLHGKTKLRRICRWCKGHINELMQYMPMPSGIPSVSTMSRVLSKVDEELVSAAVMNWICQIVDTRGKHIAIDGKGLRASASKGNVPIISHVCYKMKIQRKDHTYQMFWMI